MPLQITRQDWADIFPHASAAIIDAFTANQKPLHEAGITETRTRLAYTLANVEHECGGFTVKNLTENINYTAERMAKVWKSRFKGDPNLVIAKYGSASGWQKKAFDDIYGGRMGNRKNTSDGSSFIGRGGPQITGRDGYEQVGKRSGLDLVGNPELATLPEHQPAILAAFFSWKNLAKHADKGDFEGFVGAWNGGQIGLADRLAKLEGNKPIVMRLKNVAAIMPALDKIN